MTVGGVGHEAIDRLFEFRLAAKMNRYPAGLRLDDQLVPGCESFGGNRICARKSSTSWRQAGLRADRGRLLLEGQSLVRVCKETIYHFIYSKEDYRLGLYQYLPEGRRKRRPLRSRNPQGGVFPSLALHIPTS